MEKNKVMMIVIIALLVVLIATIIGSIVYVLRLVGNETAEIEENAKPPATDQTQIELIVLANPIATNLASGTDGTSHAARLKASIAVDISDKKISTELVELLNNRTVVIEDVIVGVLRSSTYEELSTTNAQEVLREEILTRLQQEFDTNLIQTVYISELNLQ